MNGSMTPSQLATFVRLWYTDEVLEEDAARRLVRRGLLEVGQSSLRPYVITAKGIVWMNALLATPMPVLAAAPEWKMS